VIKIQNKAKKRNEPKVGYNNHEKTKRTHLSLCGLGDLCGKKKQNEPILKIVPLTITSYMELTYDKKPPNGASKNKPISNPNLSRGA
jgi:hypothetical protein